MGYALEYNDGVEDDLAHLHPRIAGRVVSQLLRLAANAEVLRHEPLTGQWRGYYRLRIGAYRAIYDLDRDNRRIVVERVRHRSVSYDC